MQRVKNLTGFTLLELLIGVSFTGLLILSASSFFVSIYGASQQAERLAMAQMTLAHTGHWVLRTLALENQGGRKAYPEFIEPHCVLVGERGVRVRSGQLQWRPVGRACDQAGWLALHDPHGFQVLSLSWEPPMLCMTGRAATSASSPFSWCGPWP